VSIADYNVVKPWEIPRPRPVDDSDLIIVSTFKDLGVHFEQYTTTSMNPNSECLQVQTTSLHNSGFDTVAPTGSPGQFDDEVIDTGFDILERIINCGRHKIALSSVYDATDFSRLNIGSKPEKRIWVRRECKNFTMTSFSTRICLRSSRTKDPSSFQSTKNTPQGLYNPNYHRVWTKLLQRLKADDKITSESCGLHWSVLIVDRREVNRQLKGYYLDSQYNNKYTRNPNQVVARYILPGLQTMLNENSSHNYDYGFEFIVDPNAPSQRLHNQSGVEDGNSAYSPFVWLMAKESTQYIVECREGGKPVPDDLRLPHGFTEWLAWDSNHTRQTIQYLSNREIRKRGWLCGRHEWFEEERDKRNGWKAWLIQKELPLESWFWDPYTLQSWLCGHILIGE
jgi:hypothetical protein